MSAPPSSRSYRETIGKLLRGLPDRYASETYEGAVQAVLLLAAGMAIFVTLAIGAIFLLNAVDFFSQVSPVHFYTTTVWSPVIRGLYGVLPLMAATFVIAAGSAMVGLPLGLGAAVYMHEYAPPRVRAVMKPTLEILAGVPTVVWGLFAIITIAPLMRRALGADLFAGIDGIVTIGIMIVPMVSSLSEDALSAVPRKIRNGALALGATRLEVTGRVMVPAALSGILASFLLAVSRAIGETMIVLMVTGLRARLTFNPLEAMRTMTAEIAMKSFGDLPVGSLEYQSIFAVGVTLFVITLAFNFLSRWLRTRFQEVYD